MIGAILQQTLTLHMTPKDLREIADDMERLWGKALICDCLMVRTWVGDNVRVEFNIDQERMERDFGKSGTAHMANRSQR